MLLPKVELAWDLKTSKSHYTASKNGVHQQHKTAFICWILIAYLEKEQSCLGLCPSTYACVFVCMSFCVLRRCLRVLIRFLCPETVLSDAWVSQVTFPPSSHQNPCQSYCIKLVCLIIFPALLWKWITVLLTDCMAGCVVWNWIWTEVTFIKGYDTVFQSDERW